MYLALSIFFSWSVSFSLLHPKRLEHLLANCLQTGREDSVHPRDTFMINDCVLYFEHLCLRLIQGRATKILSGLECLSCKDRTERVGVVQPGKDSRETLLWPSRS